MKEALDENQEFRALNAKLSQKLEEFEQYQRANNVEVCLHVEPLAVIKQTGVIIQEEVSEADIDTCHRVPTARHDESNIFVRFIRKRKRNTFIARQGRRKWTREQWVSSLHHGSM